MKNTTFGELPIGAFFLEYHRTELGQKELPYRKTGDYELNSPGTGLQSCGTDWPVTWLDDLASKDDRAEEQPGSLVAELETGMLKSSTTASVILKIAHLHEAHWQADRQRLEAELEKSRQEAKALHRERIGEVWYWQGDEEDHIKSLTCPVLIEANDLREIAADCQVLQDEATAEAQAHAFLRHEYNTLTDKLRELEQVLRVLADLRRGVADLEQELRQYASHFTSKDSGPGLQAMAATRLAIAYRLCALLSPPSTAPDDADAGNKQPIAMRCEDYDYGDAGSSSDHTERER